MLLLQGSVELMSPSSHVHVRTDLQPKDPFAWAPCGRTQQHFLHRDLARWTMSCEVIKICLSPSQLWSSVCSIH